jgi:hypothetical protein
MAEKMIIPVCPNCETMWRADLFGNHCPTCSPKATREHSPDRESELISKAKEASGLTGEMCSEFGWHAPPANPMVGLMCQNL